MSDSDTDTQQELADCRQQVREWQIIAAVWRSRAQALEDELAHLEARRLLTEQEAADDV